MVDERIILSFSRDENSVRSDKNSPYARPRTHAVRAANSVLIEPPTLRPTLIVALTHRLLPIQRCIDLVLISARRLCEPCLTILHKLFRVVKQRLVSGGGVDDFGICSEKRVASAHCPR